MLDKTKHANVGPILISLNLLKAKWIGLKLSRASCMQPCNFKWYGYYCASPSLSPCQFRYCPGPAYSDFGFDLPSFCDHEMQIEPLKVVQGRKTSKHVLLTVSIIPNDSTMRWDIRLNRSYWLNQIFATKPGWRLINRQRALSHKE
jgi:hypothetical protein